MKDMNLHIHKAQQTPSSINSERSMLRHIILKLSNANNKRENLENSKKEATSYIQAILIKQTANFSSETMEAEHNGVKYFKN